MKIALLTCSELEQFVTDEQFLEKSIVKQGWSFQWVNWAEENVDWDQFDIAIIRTTWDYMKFKDQFLAQLRKIESSSCRLYNSMKVVEWNSDKKYLLSLQERGVATIPTQWFESCSIEQLRQCFIKFNSEKIVIKPNVGAGAYKTFLLNNDDHLLREALTSLDGIEVMVQPYLPMVAEEGEYSLHYFNGQLSHGILKRPKEGDFRSQEEFGSYIVKIDVSSEMQMFAQNVLSQVEEELLYARVDIIRNDESLNLIELELIEPSLYFRFYEPASDLLVSALKKIELKN